MHTPATPNLTDKTLIFVRLLIGICVGFLHEHGVTLEEILLGVRLAYNQASADQMTREQAEKILREMIGETHPRKH